MSTNEGVTPEAEATVETPTEGQEAEATNNEAKETDEKSPEAEEVVETPEQKIERLESELKGKQTAIDRRTAAYKSLQEKYERDRQEFQDLQSKLKSEEPLKEPSIDDFETHDDYIRAVKEHTAKVAKRQAQEEFQQRQVQSQHQQLVMQRAQKRQAEEAEYIKQNPDYIYSKAEVDSFISTMDVSEAVANAVADQAFEGNVAQLFDYFGRNNGENLDKLAEISRMTPTKAAVEIYKIQQSLKAPEKKEVKPPPKPVDVPKGGGKPRKTLEQEESVLKALGLK